MSLLAILHYSLFQAALTTQSGLQCQQGEPPFVLATSYSTASSLILGRSVHTNNITEPAHSSDSAQSELQAKVSAREFE